MKSSGPYNSMVLLYRIIIYGLLCFLANPDSLLCDSGCISFCVSTALKNCPLDQFSTDMISPDLSGLIQSSMNSPCNHAHWNFLQTSGLALYMAHPLLRQGHL